MIHANTAAARPPTNTTAGGIQSVTARSPQIPDGLGQILLGGMVMLLIGAVEPTLDMKVWNLWVHIQMELQSFKTI